MYKYTYILSESYRQNTPFIHTHLPPEHRHPPLHNPLNNSLNNNSHHINDINHHRPKIHSTTSNYNHNHTHTHDQSCTQPNNIQNLHRTKISSSAPKFNYEIDNTKLLQSHKTFIPHYQENQHESYHVANHGKTGISLNDTFVKLNQLGERHTEALREVDLQNKLKAISVKYKEQPSNNIRDSLYKKYKYEKQTAHNQTKADLRAEPDNHQKQPKYYKTMKNDYSFNMLPQAPKIQIQQQKVHLRYDYSKPILQTGASSFYGNQNEMGVTRKQVKNMITHHLSTAKYDRQQQRPTHKVQPQPIKQSITRDRERKLLIDSSNYPSTPNQTQKGKLAVQKLSTLQQRIKSSIKPYLNI